MNGCPIFGRVVSRTKFSGRYTQYLVSLIWTVSCRCLGYVILDYLFASGYIFLFTSAAGVNFPVSEFFNAKDVFPDRVQVHGLFHFCVFLPLLCLRGCELRAAPPCFVF